MTTVKRNWFKLRPNCFTKINQKGKSFQNLPVVRVTGFEPAASCSQSRRATNCATPGYLVFRSFKGYTFSFILRGKSIIHDSLSLDNR